MGNIVFQFENVNIRFPKLSRLFRSRKRSHLETTLNDINLMIAQSSQNIYPRLLNKLVQLSESEYGFLARIIDQSHDDNEPFRVEVLSISNIAWNSTSLEFYRNHFNESERVCMNLPNTLFLESIMKGRPLLINKYDQTRNILPPGHPLVRRTLVIPYSFNDASLPTLLLCVCNKFERYTKADIKSMQEILSIAALLSVRID